jgi:hypothetical protein
LSKKKRKRSKSPNTAAAIEGIPVDAADAPSENSDAGDARELYEEYVAEKVRAHRGRANRHFAAAQRLIGHAREKAEGEARAGLDRAARAFWWAEDTPMEEDQHLLLHRIGRWTRRNFGCELHFDGTGYRNRCPVAVAHKRIGQSVAFVAQRLCSLCDQDLSECEHMSGRTYWVRGGAWADGPSRVCLRDACRHRPDRLYRAPVGSIVKEVDEIREISIVRRPAYPEARLLDLPVSTADLKHAFGSDFKVGMRVSCDQCLGECPGIEDPFGLGEGFRRADKARTLYVSPAFVSSGRS